MKRSDQQPELKVPANDNGRGVANPLILAFATSPGRSVGNRAGRRITERNLNIQPTITIRPG